MADMREAIIVEAKRLEEDTLFSSKGHFEAASLWGRVNLIVGSVTTVAATLAAIFTFSHNDAVVIGLSVLVAISTGIMTFLNPSKNASIHHGSGTTYNAIRNSARMFHVIDCQSGATSDELSARLKELSHQRNDVSAKSPSIPRWAFVHARQGIEQGEAAYTVDASSAR